MWWRWWVVATVGACLTTRDSPALDCSRRSLEKLTEVSPHTISLDASYNNISCIKDELQHATKLRDINLSWNPLHSGCVNWGSAVNSLSRVSLDGIVPFPLDLIVPFPSIRHLSLRHCRLSNLNLTHVTAVKTLLLSHNLLTRIPEVRGLEHLQILHLSDNLIAEINEEDIPSLPGLHTIVLKRNRLSFIDGRAFLHAPSLRSLRLEENQLLIIPPEVQRLTQLEDLCVSYNSISRVEVGSFPSGLVRLDLGHNPLSDVHPLAFYNLTRLTTLVVWWSELTSIPSVSGGISLRTVRAAHARLTHVTSDLCRDAPQLRTLDVKYNMLSTFPDLTQCSQLRVLEVSGNQISVSVGRPLRGASLLHDLVGDHNLLSTLTHDFFIDTPRLQTINLEDNKIEHIDMETFLPLTRLEDLNLGNNKFHRLPTAGLQSLRHVAVHNNPALKHFPPPAALPRVATLRLSYAYHCCEYLTPPDRPVQERESEQLSDFVVVPPRPPDPATWANLTDLWPAYLNLTLTPVSGWTGATPQCVPRPGPFLPCNDLFEWWSLRCGVWAVFLLALLGNATVVVVLLFSRTRLDVPRFLVANLAAADLLMGLYLGILAVVDAATLGEFRAHGLAWQMSPACRLAGFLGVLSSELSVITLAVITLERNYAITHAMHLNKRLSLRHAAAVMGVGWTFALTAASLPLFGISDYRKFAVCLPFETSTPASLGYVVALLSVNGLAFLVLLGCYLKMYCAIRGSHAWNSNDSRIAKRMALLVFTDFLCWSPIAFFALTAAFGLQLVSLEEAKVFTVFVLPLNSCCNPFLYAILTKQFKKDCALVCKAIEESRVTRGIGRCRHSSNFSNRQTPANTNSLAERSSRSVHAPSCACRRLLEGEGGNGRETGRLLRWLRLVPGETAGRTGRGSVSSSVEFSSESWRRAPAPRRPAQGPSLSSSRDSSSSAATTSTSTWRAPRRPRLSRQPAMDLTNAVPIVPPLPTIPSAAEHD